MTHMNEEIATKLQLDVTWYCNLQLNTEKKLERPVPDLSFSFSRVCESCASCLPALIENFVPLIICTRWWEKEGEVGF